MTDLCRQCLNWTEDTWAICADCREAGYFNVCEPQEIKTMSTSRRKPPIRCVPCRVTYNGQRYRILSDGCVAETPTPQPKPADVGVANVAELLQWEINNLTWHDAHSPLAREVRREASRLRRNRNARERNQAMRDLGMTKTPYGWE